MKIKTLIENETISSEYIQEHGLSLYIETLGEKILFDTGKTAAYIKNAKRMNVDLSAVTMLILSHGHYDHGGGLKAFLTINSQAKIYVAKGAFDTRMAIRETGEKAYIGLDQTLKNHPQIVIVDGPYQIKKGLRLFSKVPPIYPLPPANANLFEIKDGNYVLDTFNHEHNLLIESEDKIIIVAGCAHRGICNIIDYAKNEFNVSIDIVIGGFHLHNRRSDLCASDQVVDDLADYLMATGVCFYTGHCTGVEAFVRLQKKMGARIQYLATGCQRDL